MQIIENDLASTDVIQLLQEHLDQMHATSPAESVHALDTDSLAADSITFWSVRENGELLGCGALKVLNDEHGEIKSMRTVSAHTRKGIATFMLRHIVRHAKEQGMTSLFLETGSMDEFKSARALYEKHGFKLCAPFNGYVEDTNSVFYERVL